jgi:hypothetical protein
MSKSSNCSAVWNHRSRPSLTRFAARSGSRYECNPTSCLIRIHLYKIAQKCHYLKNRLQRARQVYRSIQVEIREIQNPEVQAEWEAKAKAFDQQISKLTQDVDWAEKSTTMDKKTPTQEMKSAVLHFPDAINYVADHDAFDSRQ